MLKSAEIRRQVAQRLRELLPKAKGWEEDASARIGSQAADLLVKFRLADQEYTLVVEVSSLGQPRQIRAAVTRLAEVRRELPDAYPLAAAVYIGARSGTARGTGCRLASAVAGLLARGLPLAEAVRRAKRLVERYLDAQLGAGRGR